MNADTYVLAKCVIDAVFQCCLNAMRANEEGDEKAEQRNWLQADKLENKFKTEFGFHPLTYRELYEKSRLHSN